MLVLASVAEGAADETVLVSRAGGAGADADSGGGGISADGRFVAFGSDANNLSSEDNDISFNVFVRDLQGGATVFVSRASGATGAAADGFSAPCGISADGRFVAFISDANNLSTEDNDASRNVFVRDLQGGATVLVSRASGATGAAADDWSLTCAISANGRFVAFESEANNLSTEDNDIGNIFVRDLKSASAPTTLVSRASGATGTAAVERRSSNPAISADGRFVAFESEANNLSTEDSNNNADIFVRDLQSDATILVSRQSGPTGTAADESPSSNPAISADGRFVAFGSAADNLSTEDDDTFQSVFVRDLLGGGGATTLVSRASGATGVGADGDSIRPAISADGRFVAFESVADNLSTEDNDTFQGVFVRDLQSASAPTTLVSRASGATGTGADDSSFTPAISADGRFVTFESEANNLSTDDKDNSLDVFRRELFEPASPPPPPPPPPPTLRCAGKPATRTGSARRDVIRGSARRDVIVALGGNDKIVGLAGNDLICGGSGKDTLVGGNGKDSLRGEGGKDRLRGGAGADLLRGGAGHDALLGGPGKDKQRQ